MNGAVQLIGLRSDNSSNITRCLGLSIAFCMERDRGIVTSAGIASGIDMAISLIEQQYGFHLAAEVARYLAIYLRRNGSQSQHSAYLEYRNHLHSGVHQVQNWLAEHAMEAISLPQLAQIANMSVRSFSRAFKQATGLTPVQYQQRLRLEVAATLLQNSDLSIEAIAARCGFDDARHFRHLWQRYFGLLLQPAANSTPNLLLHNISLISIILIQKLCSRSIPQFPTAKFARKLHNWLHFSFSFNSSLERLVLIQKI